MGGTGAVTAFATTASIPANSLRVGDVVRVTAAGHYGTKATPAGTLDTIVKLGTTTMGSTGAQTMTASLTFALWWLQMEIVVQAIGASGSVRAEGWMAHQRTFTASNHLQLVNTAAVTLDTTASMDASITVDWGTSDASNTITMHTFAVQVLRTQQ